MASIYAAREGPKPQDLRQRNSEQLLALWRLCREHADSEHAKTRALVRELLNAWESFWIVLDDPHLPLANNQGYAAGGISHIGCVGKMLALEELSALKAARRASPEPARQLWGSNQALVRRRSERRGCQRSAVSTVATSAARRPWPDGCRCAGAGSAGSRDPASALQSSSRRSETYSGTAP
jgi:hypothetical protein